MRWKNQDSTLLGTWTFFCMFPRAEVHFGWTKITVRACTSWGSAPQSGKGSQDVVLKVWSNATYGGKITHIVLQGLKQWPGATVPQCLEKWVLWLTPQPAYVQQQWGGNEGVLGASTEKNYMWELCCFTVAFVNRIIEWLGLDRTLKLVQL